MAGKRASMREGPLAALFRRTDEESPEERATTSRPTRGQEDSRVREPEPRESPRPDYAQQSIEPAPEQPHRVPSPKERLSAAFAARHPARRARAPQPGRSASTVRATSRGSAAPRCTSRCCVSPASAARA